MKTFKEYLLNENENDEEYDNSEYDYQKYLKILEKEILDEYENNLIEPLELWGITNINNNTTNWDNLKKELLNRLEEGKKNYESWLEDQPWNLWWGAENSDTTYETTLDTLIYDFGGIISADPEYNLDNSFLDKELETNMNSYYLSEYLSNHGWIFNDGTVLDDGGYGDHRNIAETAWMDGNIITYNISDDYFTVRINGNINEKQIKILNQTIKDFDIDKICYDVYDKNNKRISNNCVDVYHNSFDWYSIF